jgi:hypothetical protein
MFLLVLLQPVQDGFGSGRAMELLGQFASQLPNQFLGFLTDARWRMVWSTGATSERVEAEEAAALIRFTHCRTQCRSWPNSRA